jgi:2-oxoglutarate dehydrogenase E1 component
LVLLLPHGFEGQGPEHSSARLERFLSLAAEDNIQVTYPTTPAQLFHLLRRQVVRRWRKPLVVMTPKSLLRHPEAVSALDELARGTFQRILSDARPQPIKETSLILMCSGKIYYDLSKYRHDTARKDVAILRLEQLYPLDRSSLADALAQYPDGTQVRWIQEEPENMGAWRFLRLTLGDRILERFPLCGIYRRASASPATGSHNAHIIEQERLLEAAFARVESEPSGEQDGATDARRAESGARPEPLARR